MKSRASPATLKTAFSFDNIFLFTSSSLRLELKCIQIGKKRRVEMKDNLRVRIPFLLSFLGWINIRIDLSGGENIAVEKKDFRVGKKRLLLDVGWTIKVNQLFYFPVSSFLFLSLSFAGSKELRTVRLWHSSHSLVEAWSQSKKPFSLDRLTVVLCVERWDIKLKEEKVWY